MEVVSDFFIHPDQHGDFLDFTSQEVKMERKVNGTTVLCRHGGGWSRKINAWHLYTLMVYL
jgi:hypothetical protein